MKFCPHCGASLSGGAASFCPECGKLSRDKLADVLNSCFALSNL